MDALRSHFKFVATSWLFRCKFFYNCAWCFISMTLTNLHARTFVNSDTFKCSHRSAVHDLDNARLAWRSIYMNEFARLCNWCWKTSRVFQPIHFSVCPGPILSRTKTLGMTLQVVNPPPSCICRPRLSITRRAARPSNWSSFGSHQTQIATELHRIPSTWQFHCNFNKNPMKLLVLTSIHVSKSKLFAAPVSTCFMQTLNLHESLDCVHSLCCIADFVTHKNFGNDTGR